MKIENQEDRELLTLLERLNPDELDTMVKTAESLEESKMKNAILHYRPHPKQAAFDRLLLENDVVFMFGGNGSGKTIHGAKTAVCFLMGEDPSGTTQYQYPKPKRMHTGRRVRTQGYFGCTRTDKGISIIEQDLIPLMPAGSITHVPTKNDPVLKTIWGTQLTIMSYEAETTQWQSDSLDFVWFDEQPPEKKFDEAMSRVLRRKGRIWCTMSPLFVISAWTHWRIRMNRGRKKGIAHVTVDIEDNTYLDREIKDNYINKFKGTKEEAGRLHGEHAVLSGAIHGESWVPEIHIIDPFKIDEAMRLEFKLARVMDLHARNPCVCQWFLYRRLPDPLVYQIKEFALKGQHVKIFGQRVAALTRSIGMIPTITIIDTPDSRDENQTGTSLRSELSKVKEYGRPMTGIPANRSIDSGILRFDEYLVSGRYFIFRNSNEPEMAKMHNESGEEYTVRIASNVEEDTVFSIENYRWDDWHGDSDESRDLKEKPIPKFDHWVRNCHYFSLWMPPLADKTDKFEKSLDNNTLKGVGSNQSAVRVLNHLRR